MSQAILVLGAAMQGPGRPGPALIHRARHAAALWQQGPGPLLLATGAGGEAEAIAAICRAGGVPHDLILLEPHARDTAQNLALSAPLLRARGQVRVCIVTDYYHIPRARLHARRHGLEATASAPPHGADAPLSHARALLREAAAYLAAQLS